MIGFLQGLPKPHGDQLLILTGSGVGYLVAVAPSVLAEVLNASQAELFIHTHVKEDRLELYGFKNATQKEVFELLLNVSGVGPKTALAMTDFPSEQIVMAVQNAQTGFFTKIPRVGKKLAQKIIIELRGKLGELQALDLTPPSAHAAEVHEALVSLGFDSEHVSDVLQSMEVDTLSLEAAIKAALKQLRR